MKKIELEDIAIPKIAQSDIDDTIQMAKRVVRQHVQKKETSKWLILKEVLRLQGWKLILLQTGITLSMLIGIWLSSGIQFQELAYCFLLNTGVLFSVLIGSELVRSDYYQMQELEQTCTISPQRLFLWKLWLLGGLSLLGIVIVAASCALFHHQAFLPLVYGGCLPFFLLVSITLQMQTRKHLWQSFIVLHALSFSLLLNIEMKYLEDLILLLTHYGALIVLAEAVALLLLICYRTQKEVRL